MTERHVQTKTGGGPAFFVNGTIVVPDSADHTQERGKQTSGGEFQPRIGDVIAFLANVVLVLAFLLSLYAQAQLESDQQNKATDAPRSHRLEEFESLLDDLERDEQPGR